MTSLIPDARTAQQHLESAATIGPADYAALFEVGLPLVYRELQDGSIPSIRLGNRYRISTAYVRRQLGLD